jgi:lysophospholipase L1-like esterase
MPRIVTIGVVLMTIACAPAASPPPTRGPTDPPMPPSTTAPATRHTPFPATASFRYIAVGASDSVGVGASDPVTRSWPAILRAKMPSGTAYLNVAVSGSTVAQAIAEQLPQAAAQPADAVSVWLAVNDLNAGVDPLAYAADLGRLLDGLRSNGASIFIGTVPDLTRVPVYAQVEPSFLAARVAAYNEVIRTVSAARGDRVIVVDLFTGSEVITRESVVARDGFHPSDRGYELIAERFASAMRNAGLPVR